jgi:hypothetical protein
MLNQNIRRGELAIILLLREITMKTGTGAIASFTYDHAEGSLISAPRRQSQPALP